MHEHIQLHMSSGNLSSGFPVYTAIASLTDHCPVPSLLVSLVQNELGSKKSGSQHQGCVGFMTMYLSLSCMILASTWVIYQTAASMQERTPERRLQASFPFPSPLLDIKFEG